MDDSNNNPENYFPFKTLFNKYKVDEQIGKGSFGTVFSGKIISTGEPIAIKTEIHSNKHQIDLLESEASKLIALQPFSGIPKIIYYDKVKGYNVLVMELLGESLNTLFHRCNNKFELDTATLLAYDMIQLVEYIHEKKILHRDIKPDNFVMGCGDRDNVLYIVDFGLAKKYINSIGAHIPLKKGKSITGTARYCSVYTHQGLEQGRRDDLESIGYVIMYFLKGNLPWQGVKVKKNEKHYEKIGFIKMNTKVETLCEGFPNEFQYYFNYIKQLEFTEEPNYNFLQELFLSVLKNYCGITSIRKVNRELIYDWKNPKKIKNRNDLHVHNKRKSMLPNGGGVQKSMLNNKSSELGNGSRLNNNGHNNNNNRAILNKKNTEISNKHLLKHSSTYKIKRRRTHNYNNIIMVTKESKDEIKKHHLYTEGNNEIEHNKIERMMLHKKDTKQTANNNNNNDHHPYNNNNNRRHRDQGCQCLIH